MKRDNNLLQLLNKADNEDLRVLADIITTNKMVIVDSMNSLRQRLNTSHAILIICMH